MIYYKLTKVAEAISHLLEAERAFNELETCGILDYDVTYNRCLVHSIAAFEVLQRQVVNYPEIYSETFNNLKVSFDRRVSEDLFNYFNEARNTYLHRHQSCIWIDARDGDGKLGLGSREFVSYGTKSESSRFGKSLKIIASFEFHAGSYVALRPLPPDQRRKINLPDVPVPKSHQDIDISNFTPKQCLELLLLAVGKLVCDAHEITRVV
jgi:hypothetical protein